MDKQLLDLYTDYLIASFGPTTATGLAALLDHAQSHDQITRFLTTRPFTAADLWQVVKPIVRQVQHPDGVLIIDDSIEEQPYTDARELICWHFDHRARPHRQGHQLCAHALRCQRRGAAGERGAGDEN